MERLIVRFPSDAVRIDALQGTALGGAPPRAQKQSFAQPDTIIAEVGDRTRQRLEQLGAEIFEDVAFQVLDPVEQDEDEDYRGWAAEQAQADPERFSLADVMDQVRAPAAWRHSRGEGVTIAIVDTGISPLLREIDARRRSPIDLDTVFHGQHWVDSVGHGSMCAAVAAGSRAVEGRYDGVAPGADVIAARSTLRSTDLFDIYDELVRARSEGQIKGPLVVSNSYGLLTCSSAGVLPARHPFIENIVAAIDRGIFVCFAAGNNHYDNLCRHDPFECGPNTIWGPNSHDRVMSVGTVNRDLSNRDPLTPHANSSRGPGEWASLHPKPDCVAPTYGEVPWGTGYRTMRWWGTSGACPQVAGLAALVLSVAPHLSPAQVSDIIRDTCRLLHDARTCVGRGVIDCEAGVHAALKAAAAVA